MRRGRALRRAACFVLAVALSSGVATAGDRAREPWRASLSISLQAQQQRAEGAISSTLATSQDSSRIPPVDEPLDDATHDDYFVPIVPIAVELRSPPIDLHGLPGLRDLDLEPRVFVGASYHYVPLSDRDFLTAGKILPLPPNPTAASEGLGGELRVDLQHQWSVSAGLSFPVEVGDFTVAVRPSITYLGHSIRADATVSGIQIGTDSPFRLKSEQTEVIHYLGPRLSLETDAGRTHATRWVFFVEGGLYSSRLGGQQEIENDVAQSGETMRFRYAPDALLFQVGVGFRVYWEPERGSGR